MLLHEWQQHFQKAIVNATLSDELPLQSQGLSPELSIGIYANAYRERLHEALRSNYPALHLLLGDDDFANLAYSFIDKHPSQATSIRWFGELIPHYLQNNEPYSSVPAFSELAQFEWALRHSVDAADATRIDGAYLQNLSTEEWLSLHCDLHPSLTILHFDWNVPQVWQALDEEQEPPPPTPLNCYWFVYRGEDLMTQWRSAENHEAAAIQLWKQNKDFTAICELFAQHSDNSENPAVTAASYMRTWVEQGLLVFAKNEPTEN
jgi:hypothetical protein